MTTPTLDQAVTAIEQQDTIQAAAVTDPLAGIDTEKLATMSREEMDKLIDSVDAQITTGAPVAPANTATTPTAPAPTPTPADPAAPAPAPSPEPVMVPKARLDEALAKARKTEEENIFLKGRDSALSPQKASDVPSPESQVLALDNQIRTAKVDAEKKLDDLAIAYDKGDIKTMADYRKQGKEIKSAAGATIQRAQHQRNGIIQQANQPTVEDLNLQATQDPWVQQQTDALAAANGWIQAVPDRTVQAYAQLAQQSLELGDAVPNARDLYRIRAKTVDLLREDGFDKLAAPAAAPAPAAAVPTAPAPNQAVVDKLNLSKNHPPAISQAGTGAGREEPVLNGMNPDQIMGHDAMALATTTGKDKLDALLNAFDRAS